MTRCVICVHNALSVQVLRRVFLLDKQPADSTRPVLLLCKTIRDIRNISCCVIVHCLYDAENVAIVIMILSIRAMPYFRSRISLPYSDVS